MIGGVVQFVEAASKVAVWMSLAVVFCFMIMVPDVPCGRSLAEEPPAIRLVEEAERIGVFFGDELFAQYQFNAIPRPVLWPIHGPGGIRVTRDWPLAENEQEEKRDHPHHRSLWFSHGEVNGVDFWSEGPNRGTIRHQHFLSRQVNKDQATLRSVNHWLDANGLLVLVEHRRMRFHGTTELRLIDMDFVFQAPGHDVHFGDTKEGSFGLRVAEWMAVETKMGGQIFNSVGQRDGQAWGNPADWVDYRAPRDGELVGITCMVHPASFAAPGRWHVRGYGLFAHNPFGVRDFVGEQDVAAKGGFTLAADQQIRLSYRVVLHRGDEQQANLRELFRAYSAQAIEFEVDIIDK